MRNKLLFKDLQISLEESINLVRQKFVEFKQALARLSHQEDVIPRDTTVKGLIPPPEGYLKINYDAVVRSNGRFLSMVI